MDLSSFLEKNMTFKVAYAIHKNEKECNDEDDQQETKIPVELEAIAKNTPVYWMTAYKLKYVILLLTLIPAFVLPYKSDEFRTCEDNDFSNDDRCHLRPLSTCLAASIFSIQLMAMMPRIPAKILIPFRVMEVASMLGLKVLVQMFQSTTKEVQGTTGYLGYVLLCGFITAALVSEKPIDCKTRRIYDTVLSIVTIIGMATEIALNKYQTIYSKNIAMVVICISVCALTHVCVWIATHVHKHKPKKTWGLRSFFEYLIGAILFAYITMPSTELLNASWQVWSMVAGVAVYSITFSLSKLSIRYEDALPTMV